MVNRSFTRDEYSRRWLAIRVARCLKSYDVLDVLSDLFITEGLPDFIRSDNGSEFTAPYGTG